MPLPNHLLSLQIILLAYTPKCYALPIKQSIIEISGQSAFVSILLTFFLVYLGHIFTIRPATKLNDQSTVEQRCMCLIFPTNGIHLALRSIYSAYYGDKILGIDQCIPFLKKYRNKTAKNVEDRNINTQNNLISLLPTIIPSDNHLNSEDLNENRTLESTLANAEQLRDWLVEEMAALDIYYEEYDNAPYLAALLHVIGQKKARKIKHCILNNHVLIGFDSSVYLNSQFNNLIMTGDMPISGPGEFCQYQTFMDPSYIRFLSPTMLNQITDSHVLDDSALTEILITLGQLAFTLIECTNDGDRWSKAIIIIYTLMSVLHTFSLLVLHKQVEPFSLHYSSDIPWKTIVEDHGLVASDTDNSLYNIYQHDHIDTPGQVQNKNSSDLLYRGSCLQFIVQGHRLDNKSGDKLFCVKNLNFGAKCVLGGLLGSLFICAWAGFSSHTTAKWLVLIWVASSVIVGVIYYSDLVYKIISSWLLRLLFILIITCSIYSVLGAPIIGHSL
ncbi:hypothetical protein CLU79DRAFT_740196 [Phycomyces nitens]|nr:hypothetical protein CLU79DRAFT_740196 [Phycomyces nitens]